MSIPFPARLAGRPALESLVGWPNRTRMQALALGAPPGDFVEVGVYRGGSAQALEWAAAQRPGCTLWLYDTFAGIPHADPGAGDAHKVGDFAEGLTLEAARAAFPDARIYRGVFPYDAPLPERVAFAHLDVDQYQSYRDAFAALFPRMVPGGMVLCDDAGLAGCARAVLESGRRVELLPDPDGRFLFRC